MKFLSLIVVLAMTAVSVGAHASPVCSPEELAELTAGLEERAKDADLSIGDRELAELVLADFQKEKVRRGCKKKVTHTGIVQFLTVTTTIGSVVTFSGPKVTKITTARF